MLVTADFSVVPDEYAKLAPADARVDGVPCISFPFTIERLDPQVKYLHWQFTDPDSIPVCGFEWIHWTVANLPVDAVMFDPADPNALAIPADFSRKLPAMIPEALQGRNSSASHFVGRSDDPQLIARYNGPQPPDQDHEYVLQVWGTSKPLPDLEQSFWLNELLHRLDACRDVRDAGGLAVIGKA